MFMRIDLLNFDLYSVFNFYNSKVILWPTGRAGQECALHVREYRMSSRMSSIGINEIQLKAMSKEVVDLDNKLKGQNFDLSYLIPGFSGSSLLELCSHLQVKNSFRPNEVIPFLHSLLTDVGLGWCVPKPSSIQLLTSFEDKFEEKDFKTIQMRSFIVRVYQEFDYDDLRLSFLENICFLCNVNSKKYSHSYRLFKFIENIECVHTRDETGLSFIIYALTTDAEFAKVLTFAKGHIINGMFIYAKKFK